MSDQRTTIFDRFQSAPRAVQWAIYFGIFLLLFVVWVDQLAPLKTKWDNQADKIKAQVDAVNGGANLISSVEKRQSTIIALGPSDMPMSETKAGEALTGAVVTVFDQNRVDNHEYTLSRGKRLPRTVASGLVSGRERLVQLSCEVKFSATPDQTMQIIADFENRPEVAAVSQVRLRKGDRGSLEVSLTLDAWVIEESGSSA